MDLTHVGYTAAGIFLSWLPLGVASYIGIVRFQAKAKVQIDDMKEDIVKLETDDKSDHKELRSDIKEVADAVRQHVERGAHISKDFYLLFDVMSKRVESIETYLRRKNGGPL